MSKRVFFVTCQRRPHPCTARAHLDSIKGVAAWHASHVCALTTSKPGDTYTPQHMAWPVVTKTLLREVMRP